MARAKYFETLGIGASPLTPSFADVVATSVIPFVAVSAVAFVVGRGLYWAIPPARAHRTWHGIPHVTVALTATSVLGITLMLTSWFLGVVRSPADWLLALLGTRAVWVGLTPLLFLGSRLSWMKRDALRKNPWMVLLVVLVVLLPPSVLVVASPHAIWLRQWMTVVGLGLGMAPVVYVLLGIGMWRLPGGAALIAGPLIAGLLFPFVQSDTADAAAHFRRSFSGQALQQVTITGSDSSHPDDRGYVLDAGDGRVLLVTWKSETCGTDPRVWGIDISNASISSTKVTAECTRPPFEWPTIPRPGWLRWPFGSGSDIGEALDTRTDPAGASSNQNDSGSQPHGTIGPDPVGGPSPPNRTFVPHGGTPVPTPTSTSIPTSIPTSTSTATASPNSTLSPTSTPTPKPEPPGAPTAK